MTRARGGRPPKPEGTLSLWADGRTFVKQDGSWVRASGTPTQPVAPWKTREELPAANLDAGAARTSDPETSKAAARAQRGGTRQAILAAFERCGALTDDELCGLVLSEADRLRRSPTVKSARSRLANEGVLLPTGETRLSDCGQPMQVWALAAIYREIETVHDAKERVA